MCEVIQALHFAVILYRHYITRILHFLSSVAEKQRKNSYRCRNYAVTIPAPSFPASIDYRFQPPDWATDGTDFITDVYLVVMLCNKIQLTRSIHSSIHYSSFSSFLKCVIYRRVRSIRYFAFFDLYIAAFLAVKPLFSLCFFWSLLGTLKVHRLRPLTTRLTPTNNTTTTDQFVIIVITHSHTLSNLLP